MKTPSDPGLSPVKASVGQTPSADGHVRSAVPVTFEQLEAIAFAVLDLLQLINIGRELPPDGQAQRDQLVAQACQLIEQIWQMTARQWGGASSEREARRKPVETLQLSFTRPQSRDHLLGWLQEKKIHTALLESTVLISLPVGTVQQEMAQFLEGARYRVRLPDGDIFFYHSERKTPALQAWGYKRVLLGWLGWVVVPIADA